MTERWDWEYAVDIFPALLEGLYVLVRATLAGIVVAVILGLFLALGRRSQRRWISYPFAWFIEFVRSTPLLIQLFFIYYALPTMDIFGTRLVFDAELTLIAGLGVHYGCYASEAYRAGIDSVATGQWEASTALNLRTYTKWRNIILPQAVPRTLPTLGNYFVAMFKDAPLGAIITVPGMLAEARALASATLRQVEPYTIVGLLFLAVSIPAALMVRRLERRVHYEA